MAEVNTAINHMDRMTRQNAAMVGETSAASLTLNRESNQLSGMLRKVRLLSSHPHSKAAQRASLTLARHPRDPEPHRRVEPGLHRLCGRIRSVFRSGAVIKGAPPERRFTGRRSPREREAPWSELIGERKTSAGILSTCLRSM